MSIHVPEEIERKADEICHNNADVEVAWATKCHMFAEEHEKLLAETPRNAMVELSGCVAHRVSSSVVAVPLVQSPGNGLLKEGRRTFSLLPTPLASLVLHPPTPLHPHYSFGQRSITVPLFATLRTSHWLLVYFSSFLPCQHFSVLPFPPLSFNHSSLYLLHVLFSFCTHVPLPFLFHSSSTSTSSFSYFSSFSTHVSHYSFLLSCSPPFFSCPPPLSSTHVPSIHS